VSWQEKKGYKRAQRKKETQSLILPSITTSLLRKPVADLQRGKEHGFKLLLGGIGRGVKIADFKKKGKRVRRRRAAPGVEGKSLVVGGENTVNPLRQGLEEGERGWMEIYDESRLLVPKRTGKIPSQEGRRGLKEKIPESVDKSTEKRQPEPTGVGSCLRRGLLLPSASKVQRNENGGKNRHVTCSRGL